MMKARIGKNFEAGRSVRGSTLIESLIAVLLLAFVMSVGVNLYSNADKISLMALHKRMAVEMMMAQLEKARLDGYPALSVGHSEQEISLGGTPAKRVLTIRDVDEAPEDGVVDYKEITVDIRWQEAHSATPRDVTFSTFIAP